MLNSAPATAKPPKPQTHRLASSSSSSVFQRQPTTKPPIKSENQQNTAADRDEMATKRKKERKKYHWSGILNSSEGARVKNFTRTKLLSQPGLLGAISSWCTISPESTERGPKLAIRSHTARIISSLLIVRESRASKGAKGSEARSPEIGARAQGRGDKHTVSRERDGEREREREKYRVLEIRTFSKFIFIFILFFCILKCRFSEDTRGGRRAVTVARSSNRFPSLFHTSFFPHPRGGEGTRGDRARAPHGPTRFARFPRARRE